MYSKKSYIAFSHVSERLDKEDRSQQYKTIAFEEGGPIVFQASPNLQLSRQETPNSVSKG